MKHFRSFPLTVLLVSLLTFYTHTPAYASVIDVSGNIDSNTTWTNGNIYRVTGDVTVINGVTLTIESGVIVKFNDDIRLAIDGKLLAAGTAGQPIYFTSYRDDSIGGDTDGGGASAGSKGDWARIEFHAGSDDSSLLEHVIVRYAGERYNDNDYGNIYLLDASPTIRNSTIAFSYQDGVYLESTLGQGSSSPTITNTVFTTNNSAGISVDMDSLPAVSGNTSLNNGTNGLEVRGGTVSNNTTWNQTSMVYRLIGDVTVANGATLTIVPNMIVKFNDDIRLAIDGKLLAAGTAGQPIYFTSYRDDSIGGDTDGGGASAGSKGDWARIEFHAGSDDSSLLEHVIVRYAGERYNDNDYGNIYLLDASPTIRNSTIAFSYQDGIYAEGSQPTLTCNDIRDNNAYGVRNVTMNVTVNAINQYWGSASGPYHPTLNPSGLGNDVSDGVSFIPWQQGSCLLSFKISLPLIRR